MHPTPKPRWKNGFDLTDYDERTLDYAKEYSRKLLAIDVNIDIDEMLDTGWYLFNKYFTKAEVGLKEELVYKYWPEEEGLEEKRQKEKTESEA